TRFTLASAAPGRPPCCCLRCTSPRRRSSPSGTSPGSMRSCSGRPATRSSSRGSEAGGHMKRTVEAALAAAVLAAAPADADSPLPIQLPQALVFPNYDNVLLGKDQALEGGSFVARAGDASANFYNPAGLVQSEKSSLNASSTGWVRTKITAEALDTSVTSTKIDNVPGYFGA